MEIEYFLKAAADAVLPRYCVVCGRRLRINETDICLFCMADLPYTYMWKYPPEWLLPLYFYRDNSPYKRLAITVKYMGNADLGFRLGKQLGHYAAEMYSGAGMKIDVVAPVPLHWFRRFSRGYNQAERIAEGFISGYSSASGHIPLFLPRLIKRNVYTKSQTSVDVRRKAANVCKAFGKGSQFGELERLVSVSSGHPVLIVIIDDTCTTGATLLAAASVLGCLRHATDVRFATLAKVKED